MPSRRKAMYLNPPHHANRKLFDALCPVVHGAVMSSLNDHGEKAGVRSIVKRVMNQITAPDVEARIKKAVMDDWQPIETAPKDGSRILLKGTPGDLIDRDGEIVGKQDIGPIEVGHWCAEATSWGKSSQDGELVETGVWFAGGGWFEPDEVLEWKPL